MSNPEKYVPPENGKGLFSLMRGAVGGKVETEEIIDETGPIGTRIIGKSKTTQLEPQTGAGAMVEWQKQQEEIEDRRAEQTRKAA